MTDSKVKYFLGPLLFLTTVLFGQEKLDFSINIESLKKSGVDTFFIYKPYCYNQVGIRVPRKATEKEIHDLRCEHSDQTFLFFKFKGNTIVTMFNECYKFSPITITDSKSFPYFIMYFNELIKDTIKIAQVLDKDGNRLTVGQDHSCYRDIYLFINQGRRIYIDLYDFNEDVYTGRNINFSFNMQTYIKKFIDLISKELETIKFGRQTDQKE